jgi:altronate dehydratase
MKKKSRAVVINPADTVATALETLETGEKVIVEIANRREDFTVMSKIPQGHKFSLKDTKKGDSVIKYGEPIGVALTDIGRGEHVHVHNIASASQIRRES